MFYNLLFSTFREDLPVGLALCIVPFVLGWLFSFLFHGVSGLQQQVKTLTQDKSQLEERVKNLDNTLTETRMKLSQCEAELESTNANLRKCKNDLMLAESERNMLKEQVKEQKK
jgi:peptidoglycan hydrolase CwlO-like protein